MLNLAPQAKLHKLMIALVGLDTTLSASATGLEP